MSKYNYIINHPDKYFSLSQISEALRTSKQSVDRWVLTKQLKSVKGMVGIRKGYLVKGEWLRDYIFKLNEYTEVEGWKNLNQILSDYKLPYERK